MKLSDAKIASIISQNPQTKARLKNMTKRQKQTYINQVKRMANQIESNEVRMKMLCGLLGG